MHIHYPNHTETAMHVTMVTAYSQMNGPYDHGMGSHHSLCGKQTGNKWKRRQILFSWAPKITADGDYSYEINRHLLFGRKTM